MFKFHVAYKHSNGYGRIVLLRDRPIELSEDLTKIEQMVEKERNASKVIVLSWQELK